VQILRLNKAGQPIEWLNWQQATCLYSRDLMCWSSGETIYRIHGGRNRISGRQSIIELPSIMACGGARMARPRNDPPLNNRTLFERDGYQCLYCGKKFPVMGLTRDHIIPSSRGGKDTWMNVVAACRRCNQYKGNRLLNEINMELIALPYRPNSAEYLALVNSRRILQTQADFLSRQFSSNCRWQMPEAV
jgi:5-methylcytosine-specific restriction endonuclease McrA